MIPESIQFQLNNLKLRPTEETLCISFFFVFFFFSFFLLFLFWFCFEFLLLLLFLNFWYFFWVFFLVFLFLFVVVVGGVGFVETQGSREGGRSAAEITPTFSVSTDWHTCQCVEDFDSSSGKWKFLKFTRKFQCKMYWNLENNVIQGFSLVRWLLYL